MRASPLFTWGLFFSFSVAQAQPIPNSGFEDWTNMGTFSEPVGWLTNNVDMDPQVSTTQQQPGYQEECSWAALDTRSHRALPPWMGTGVMRP